MSDAVSSSMGVVAYLAMFAVVGLLFIFVNLLIGRFVRPRNPSRQKLAVYECGEPAVGSSFVQFDLRFYVVALLFIIFDVEVAFFFPWATVFGKATHLMDVRPGNAVVDVVEDRLELTDNAQALYREMGVRNPTVPERIPSTLASKIDAAADPAARSTQIIKLGARQLALITLVDIAIFFAVLMVGFAYVWKRGDLDWVRAVRTPEASEQQPPHEMTELDLEQVLSA